MVNSRYLHWGEGHGLFGTSVHDARSYQLQSQVVTHSKTSNSG